MSAKVEDRGKRIQPIHAKICGGSSNGGKQRDGEH